MTHFFKRHATGNSLFSLALAEAIKDTFKEMGYGFDRDIKKKGNDNQDLALPKFTLTDRPGSDNRCTCKTSFE
jgi:hypothetical protein